MTNPRIEAFLRRPLNDFRWMKELSEKDIDDALTDLNPDFKGPLRRHQKIGFLLGIAQPHLYYQYQMGLGKSLLSLEIASYLYKHGKLKKAIVLMPMNELIDGWIEEIEKWGIKIPYVGLKGSSDDKWDDYYKMDRGLALVSYPAMVHMTCEKQKLPGKTKMEMQPEKRLVKDFVKGVDGIWYDEITKTKSHKSLTFLISNQIAKVAKYRYGLAGRMFGRNPEDVWTQFYLIDRGDTFSYSLTFFREAFFVKRKRYFGGPYSFEYIFDRKMDTDFNRMMANSSLRFSVEECDIDMPDVINIKKHVSLAKGSVSYYQQALGEIRKAKGNRREIEHAFIRMRQISSGFLGFVDDDTGERAQIEFPENPKLDLLLDLIDDMPHNCKAIISVDFTWSGMTISKALHKMKIRHGWLYGQTRDWNVMKDKFDSDPDFRFLIVQSRKGSLGLNLQVASYLFLYESPVPVLDRVQLEARINRQGQKRTVFIYDLVCRDTADESILAFHRQGHNIYDALVKNPDEALRKVT